jgi:hypothetical protein
MDEVRGQESAGAGRSLVTEGSTVHVAKQYKQYKQYNCLLTLQPMDITRYNPLLVPFCAIYAFKQALLDFVASQELLLLHLSGLAAVPDAAAAAEPPCRSDTQSPQSGCSLQLQSSSTYNNSKRPGSSGSLQDSCMTPPDAPTPVPQAVNQRCRQLQQLQQGGLNMQMISSTAHTSYVAQLLQNASAETIQRVMSMTAEDWVQVLQDDYDILSSLLQRALSECIVASSKQQQQQQQQQQELMLQPVSHDAAAAAARFHLGLPQPVVVKQEQLQMLSAWRAPAAAAAASLQPLNVQSVTVQQEQLPTSTAAAAPAAVSSQSATVIQPVAVKQEPTDAVQPAIVSPRSATTESMLNSAAAPWWQQQQPAQGNSLSAASLSAARILRQLEVFSDRWAPG